MNCRTLLLLAVFAFGCAMQNVARSEQAAVEQIAKLEVLWNAAHLSGDAAVLERLSADDLVVTVSAMQPMSKSEAFGFLRTGRMKFQRYETSGVLIRTYNKDTAVVTGRLQRTRTMGDRTLEDDWRFTKVYVRGAGDWRVVSFHASPAK
jgi:hypothetical protein